MLKSNLLSGVSIATVSIAMTIPAQAQTAIDEVVVTARKKAESLQDVPIAVSALDEKLLDELGIDVFSDYLLQMPGITAGGSGPGGGGGAPRLHRGLVLRPDRGHRCAARGL